MKAKVTRTLILEIEDPITIEQLRKSVDDEDKMEVGTTIEIGGFQDEGTLIGAVLVDIKSTVEEVTEVEGASSR